MIIGDIMREPEVTVNENTFINDARYLMKVNRLKILPVKKNGMFAGIISEETLENYFAITTSISCYNRRFFLINNLTVKEFINNDPFLVSPEMTIIDALRLSREKGCCEFPVVDKGRLVGITNESEIIKEIFSRYI